jgi:hypothetical protein
MTKTIVLAEALDLSEAQFDTENRVLRNVVLIKAGKSLNKRYYSEAALQNAVSVFEGSKAFDSHAKGERRVGELTGYYENVRYDSGKLIADRRFLPTNAGKDVMAVVSAIISEGAPRNLAGLSINAVGTGKMGKYDGEDMLGVESITSANSVDDVVSPAAGGGYTLTASTGDELANAYIAALTYEEWFESRPEFIKRVQNEMKAVRQDEAVKVATANADTLQTALNEAQSQLETLKNERDAALVEAGSKARELALEKTFRKVSLPLAVESDLRERLMESAPEKWLTIISGERTKLTALGLKPRVAVTGAGQQIAESVQTIVKLDPLKEARKAVASASSPEELLKIRESLGR